MNPVKEEEDNELRPQGGVSLEFEQQQQAQGSGGEGNGGVDVNGDGNATKMMQQQEEEHHQHRLQQRQQPDFGVDFIPDSTMAPSNGAVSMAPKSLDHYQRGYEDRMIHRDRDPIEQQHHHQQHQQPSLLQTHQSSIEHQDHYNHASPPPSNARSHNNNTNSYRGGGGGGGGGSGNEYHRSSNNQYNTNPGGRGNYYDRGDRHGTSDHHHHRSNYAGDRPRFTDNHHHHHGGGGNHDDPWNQQNHRDNRPTILQGLDINALADRLTTKLHDKRALFNDLDRTRIENRNVFDSGKALTALISIAARRKNIGLGHAAWDWMDKAGIAKNTFHYNSMISVTEKARDYQHALALLQEMKDRNIKKNEVTFSSAISACEKCGMWQKAMHLLDTMVDEGVPRTAIAFNATISACEKGMVPQKACEVFHRMKREGIAPSVVSYSALISAAEKGGQWRLALEILEEMKAEGFRGNVVAYSAAISALAKGQQWRKALQLFREIQSQRGTPSIVTYNATMTALEKGMEWERALDLFEEMKMNNLPITVVSYGSAISACDKGFQFRQCLEFLDEMTEMGIPKNVIIFGAAMSCMEKCSRADIGFQLMKRMKEEGIQPNVHIYNSAISACARSNLWEKGYELYEEMDREGVKRDVVTFNAVLDAVCSQIPLGRRLFKVGVERGFYAKVSRLGDQWFELDLHFLSLGGGEIALGWWFEECLVPYLIDTDKLANVKSISIVTGYGKTRTRGRRHGDDGMRKRCRAMLRYMGITEQEQPNLGRIHIDKESLIELVNKNGGRIIFDLDSYISWKEEEAAANALPDVEQKIRARFKPTIPGSGGPPFTRVESEHTTDEYRLENHEARMAKIREQDMLIDSDIRNDPDHAIRDSESHQGRGDPSKFSGPERGPYGDRNENRPDQDRYGGPRSRVPMNNENLRVRNAEEGHPYGDSRVMDRDQQFRDRNVVQDNNAHFRNGPPYNRDGDSNFPRINQNVIRNDPGSNYSDHHYREHLHRPEQIQDHDQQRFGGRMDSNNSSFRDTRDYGASHVHRPVTTQTVPQRRYPGEYDDRSMAMDIPRAGFAERDSRNNLERGLPDDQRGSWRASDSPSNRQVQSGSVPDFDSGVRRGQFDDRAHDGINSRYHESHNYKGPHDSGMYRDGSQLDDQHLPASFASRDNYERNDPSAHAFDDEMARKRQYDDSSDRFGLQQATSNNSRGYALEPEAQRRRFS